MRDRIGQNFPYEIKTNTPKFSHIDIVNMLEVRYVCFNFIGEILAYSVSHASLPFLPLPARPLRQAFT